VGRAERMDEPQTIVREGQMHGAKVQHRTHHPTRTGQRL
jgi:hypothetical protein